MEYRHTPIFQEVLQKALRLRRIHGAQRSSRNPFTWEELSQDLEIDAGGEKYVSKRMTLMRFDHTNIDRFFQEKGRLFLGLKMAYGMWEKLAPEIRQVLRDNSELRNNLFGERCVANVISWNYRCHQSQIENFVKKDGLEGSYFCYKPSFRIPGNVIKSAVTIESCQDEYLLIQERQESTMEKGGTVMTEASSGTGISKSNKIWMFLKEHQAEQPRVLCFHRIEKAITRTQFEETGSISRLFGQVLESDETFGHGVYAFNVCLVSSEADMEAHADRQKGQRGKIPYDVNRQINNVPATPKAAKRYSKDYLEVAKHVFLDQKAMDWIKVCDSPSPAPLS